LPERGAGSDFYNVILFHLFMRKYRLLLSYILSVENRDSVIWIEQGTPSILAGRFDL
jgi:hypothetical protein